MDVKLAFTSSWNSNEVFKLKTTHTKTHTKMEKQDAGIVCLTDS